MYYEHTQDAVKSASGVDMYSYNAIRHYMVKENRRFKGETLLGKEISFVKNKYPDNGEVQGVWYVKLK